MPSIQELRAQEERLRAALTERYALIGRIIVSRMDRDPEFKETITTMLSQEVTDRAERALLDLPEPARPEAPAGTTGRRRGRPRKVDTQPLSGDQPDRGADMA